MDKNQPTSGIVGIGRLIWVALGPALLAVATSHIFLEGTGWHTAGDYVLFTTTLATMILGRWLEVLEGVPLISSGEPSTRKDFYRYAAFVLVVGLSVLSFAIAFGNRGTAQSLSDLPPLRYR
jgi:hypothetical protein